MKEAGRLNILVVDDEPDIRSTLADILEDEGYRVTQAASAADCIPARAFTLKTFGEHLSDVIESANETVVAIKRLFLSAT